MPFVSLQYPPGIYRNGTEYQSQGRWHDGRFVRWDDGIMKPMLGWASFATGLTGSPRNMHTWTNDSFAAFVGVGTTDGLFSISSAGALSDRTGVGFTSDADGIWTLGNIGDQFIACMDSDETIWTWDAGGTSAATALANAPSADAVVVTEQGFVVALGAGGSPRSLRTSNLREPTVWTPATTNQARDFTIQTSGKIMAGQQVRGGTLIFTDEDLHLLTYTGTGPLFHRLEKIPGSRGLVARNAKASVGTNCFFMGSTNFWVYNGFIQALPCDVEDDVFKNINRAHISKVQCFHNADEQEIWWLYPRGSATENSHYVIYNYSQQHWNHGELDRACGIGPGGGFDLPLMCEGADVFTHETGFSYGGVLPFARGGPLELGEGDQVLEAYQMVPDEGTAGDMEVTVYTRFYPNGTEYTFGPYQSDNPMGVRFSGRQAAMELTATAGADWRMGSYRVDTQPGGER